MTAFACARVAKLTTAAQIAAVAGHNARTRPTPNSDPRKRNHAFVAASDPVAAVRQRIEAAGVRPRKGAVLAVEMILTTSPEYFRPGRPEAAGEWDRERTTVWAKRSWEWLRSEYGDRVIDARLHLDESTPHIQALIVPLTGDGRLSARDMFGREQCRNLQTSFSAALKPLGIQRGLEGSKAEHTRVREFYAAAMAPLPPDPAPVPTMAVEPPPFLIGKKKRAEWAKVHNRKAALQAEAETRRIRASSRPVREKARLTAMREREIEGQRATIAYLADKKAEAEAARDSAVASAVSAEVERKAEVAKLRDIPLEKVCLADGLERDTAGWWSGPGHSIKVEGAKWFEHGSVGHASGKGSIDLVKHLTGCDYEEALAWLRDKIGPEPAAAAHVAEQREKAAEVIKMAKPQALQMPSDSPFNWPDVRQWLLDVRRLPARLVDWLHDRRQVYADARRNAVFIMTSLAGKVVGAEMKGTLRDKKFTAMAPGSSRNDGWFQLAVGANAANRLVLTEAAIDAISYASLHPVPPGKEGYVVASTGGVRSNLPDLAHLAKRGVKIVVAYDNDQRGNDAASKLISAYASTGGVATRERPKWGKDWNDMLMQPRPLEPEPKRSDFSPEPSPF